MTPEWIKYSFFTKVVTCEKCGEREYINPSSVKYIEGQVKIFAKYHQHEQLPKPEIT
jgi:hypothetical protein